MDPYAQMAEAIIQKQVLILAGMAIERASKVKGLTLDSSGHVTAVKDGEHTLEELIAQFQELLGPAGISFARDAALPIAKQHPEIQLPKALQ